jgi:hypothetical protein
MRVRTFFVREAVLAKPDIEAAPADKDAALIMQPSHHLVQRNVLLRLDQTDDEGFMPSSAEACLRPVLRGCVSPRLARSTHRMAVDADTPNRSAAPRAESPPRHAFKTRSRKSMLRARPIQITSIAGEFESELAKTVTSQSIHRSVDVL